MSRPFVTVSDESRSCAKPGPTSKIVRTDSQNPPRGFFANGLFYSSHVNQRHVTPRIIVGRRSGSNTFLDASTDVNCDKQQVCFTPAEIIDILRAAVQLERIVEEKRKLTPASLLYRWDAVCFLKTFNLGFHWLHQEIYV